MKRLAIAIFLLPTLAFAQAPPQATPSDTDALNATQATLAAMAQLESYWHARAMNAEAALSHATTPRLTPPHSEAPDVRHVP